jgi:hypothetical protein
VTPEKVECDDAGAPVGQEFYGVDLVVEDFSFGVMERREMVSYRRCDVFTKKSLSLARRSADAKIVETV